MSEPTDGDSIDIDTLNLHTYTPLAHVILGCSVMTFACIWCICGWYLRKLYSTADKKNGGSFSLLKILWHIKGASLPTSPKNKLSPNHHSDRINHRSSHYLNPNGLSNTYDPKKHGNRNHRIALPTRIRDTIQLTPFASETKSAVMSTSTTMTMTKSKTNSIKKIQVNDLDIVDNARSSHCTPRCSNTKRMSYPFHLTPAVTPCGVLTPGSEICIDMRDQTNKNNHVQSPDTGPDFDKEEVAAHRAMLKLQNDRHLFAETNYNATVSTTEHEHEKNSK